MLLVLLVLLLLRNRNRHGERLLLLLCASRAAAAAQKRGGDYLAVEVIEAEHSHCTLHVRRGDYFCACFLAFVARVTSE